MNILVVEDEKIFADSLYLILKNIEQVNVVDFATSFEEGFEKFNTGTFDLVLVDVNLSSDMTGIDLCETIRKVNKEIPLIVVTSYSSHYYLEKAFSVGVNDYVTKPFDSRELELRIRRWLLLSHRIFVDTKIRYEELLYDVERNEFFYKGERLMLTRREKLLLLIFVKNKEHILSTRFLEQKFWGGDNDSQTRNIRASIQTLKRTLCLQKIPVGNWLQNKRGEGYLFEKVQHYAILN